MQHRTCFIAACVSKKRVFIRTAAIILALLVIALLPACSKTDKDPVGSVAGNTFVWEKEGFGGDFTVSFHEDGTYEYYVGFLSSYIGSGDWTMDDDVLTLNETSGYDLVFRFSLVDDELVYLSEGSDRFIGVTVEDGDRFLPVES